MLVKFFADIRHLCGGREQQQHAGAAPTVRKLLEELSDQHGAAFRRRVFEGDGLSRTLIVFVNGQNVEHLRGIETPLGPEDVIAIFPMIAGG
jgi:molybdopterin synthase sulfur carrier subunit